MFTNSMYDRLKWIALVFLPALITFAGVVLNALHIEYTEVILTIAIGFNTFLGSVLGVSNINYHKTAELREETTNGIGDDEDAE